MKKKYLKKAIVAGLISMGLVGSVNAALLGRLAATPGGTDYQAYYDDAADLTWLADANYAQTSGYTGTGVTPDGRMTWQAANNWAAQLTVGGMGGWRLSNTHQVNATNTTESGGTGSTSNGSEPVTLSDVSELSNLLTNSLGNTVSSGGGFFDNGCTVNCSITTGPFSNVQSFPYWSDTENASNTSFAWAFNMNDGSQISVFKPNNLNAWAVQSGDISVVPGTVPVPAAVWLFGSGLLGLVGVARHRA